MTGRFCFRRGASIAKFDYAPRRGFSHASPVLAQTRIIEGKRKRNKFLVGWLGNAR